MNEDSFHKLRRNNSEELSTRETVDETLLGTNFNAVNSIAPIATNIRPSTDILPQDAFDCGRQNFAPILQNDKHDDLRSDLLGLPECRRRLARSTDEMHHRPTPTKGSKRSAVLQHHFPCILSRARLFHASWFCHVVCRCRPKEERTEYHVEESTRCGKSRLIADWCVATTVLRDAYCFGQSLNHASFLLRMLSSLCSVVRPLPITLLATPLRLVMEPTRMYSLGPPTFS